MSFLELQNITKIYPNGTKAVNETSLNIENGEFVVFVGPTIAILKPSRIISPTF